MPSRSSMALIQVIVAMIHPFAFAELLPTSAPSAATRARVAGAIVRPTAAGSLSHPRGRCKPCAGVGFGAAPARTRPHQPGCIPERPRPKLLLHILQAIVKLQGGGESYEARE